MTFIRKALTLIVMILAVVGFVLCVVGTVGAWVMNTPATQAATGALSSIEQYGALAGQTVRLLGETVAEAKSSIDDVNGRLTNVTDAARAQFAESVRQRLDGTVGPKVERASATARTLWQTAVGVNDTLVSVNRMPGINVPTFTAELEAVDARLGAVRTSLTDVRASVADAQFDSSRLQAATEKVSQELGGIQQTLTVAQARLASMSSTTSSLKAALPGWIDGVSVVVTLLSILFGAGQIFLFKAALDWFKRL